MTADEDERAQHAERLRQLLDHRNHTRAVEGEVHGRAGDLRDLRDEIRRGGVDRVRRAELLRQRQAIVVDVGGDDLGDTRVAGRHDRCETDGPDPDDEHRVA